MTHRFETTTTIDRPIDEVFAFLANGENDRQFNPRLEVIAKTTDGPPGVGTVYESTIKYAGRESHRAFRLTEFEPPNRIRWTEDSKGLVTSPEGGYDLEASDGATRVTLFNATEGHGLGKLFVPVALRAARKDAGPFAERIKRAVETSE